MGEPVLFGCSRQPGLRAPCSFYAPFFCALPDHGHHPDRCGGDRVLRHPGGAGQPDCHDAAPRCDRGGHRPADGALRVGQIHSAAVPDLVPRGAAGGFRHLDHLAPAGAGAGAGALAGDAGVVGDGTGDRRHDRRHRGADRHPGARDQEPRPRSMWPMAWRCRCRISCGGCC
jgi:hypothetical protein